MRKSKKMKKVFFSIKFVCSINKERAVLLANPPKRLPKSNERVSSRKNQLTYKCTMFNKGFLVCVSFWRKQTKSTKKTLQCETEGKTTHCNGRASSHEKRSREIEIT